MGINAIVGIVVVGLALSGISFLVFWSRRSIEMMRRNGHRTLRQVIIERRTGKSK